MLENSSSSRSRYICVISRKVLENIFVTSWREGGLEKMVEEKKLYPITALFSLNEYAVRRLLEAGVVLVKELALMKPKVLQRLTGIPFHRAIIVIREAEKLNR